PSARQRIGQRARHRLLTDHVGELLRAPLARDHLIGHFLKLQSSELQIAESSCRLNRGPESPAAHVRICLALLPSGPDAVRRLKLHRFRTAVQSATTVRLKPDTTDAGSNPRRRSGSNRTLLMP